MTMHRFNAVFFSLVLTVAAVLSGCGGGGNLEEKLYGGWKSEVSGADGKPIVAIITNDSITINGKSEAVTFQSMALNVEIIRASDRKALLMATGIGNESIDLLGDILPLDTNHINYKGETLGVKVKFVRISEEEAQQLMDGPQSKARTESWTAFVASLW